MVFPTDGPLAGLLPCHSAGRPMQDEASWGGGSAGSTFKLCLKIAIGTSDRNFMAVNVAHKVLPISFNCYGTSNNTFTTKTIKNP